ncbi:DNA methyltransferase family protein [Micromonospora carbonacea]|uniref:hypothetical protein n=1 Tax=Micromonospora carbonacea TaxID=47853 RepID=UPI003710ED74
MNPVDDRTFVNPLVKALHRHTDRLADSIPGPRTHDGHQRRQRIAAAWVYLSAIVAWAEDHHLIDVTLHAGLRDVPARYTTGTARPVVALAQAMGNLTVHPATQWLMHPAYNTDLHEGTPSDDAVQALADWWAADAPSLAYEVTAEPPSISGWLIGDLLQTITDERRKGFALAQTPWWICDFLLDRTLIPACAEFRTQRLIRTIDPTAGTGHMLIRAMDYLWEWYTTGTLRPRQAVGGPAATGGTRIDPQHALPRVVASVDGIEIDPLTAAVARLRCTVYAAHLAHQAGYATGPLRLDTIPRDLIPRVGVADSLLLGKVDRATYASTHPHLADLPGASFTGDDWDHTRPTAASPAALCLAAPQQLDLFDGIAA